MLCKCQRTGHSKNNKELRHKSSFNSIFLQIYLSRVRLSALKILTEDLKILTEDLKILTEDLYLCAMVAT